LREMSVNIAYKYLFHPVGICNTPYNLTWDRRLYVPSEGIRAADYYYRP